MSVTFKYFCPHCGAPNLPMNGSKPKFCGKCGGSFQSSVFSEGRKVERRKPVSVIEDDDPLEDDEEFFDESSFGSREEFKKHIVLEFPKVKKQTIGDLAEQEKTGFSRPAGNWMREAKNGDEIKAAIRKECSSTKSIEL